jgi:hypothetical protein
MGAACALPETAAEMAAATMKMTVRNDMGFPFSGQDFCSPNTLGAYDCGG